MPTVISRERAIARLDPGADCLICELLRPAAEPLTIAESARVVVLLPRFATRWGHVMVVPREHVTSFSDVTDALWEESSRLALCAARAIERSMSPLRCYVASLGAPREDLPMTSAHLHVHVIPIYDVADRPRTVLTWSNGVHVGTEAEWHDLRDRLLEAWGQVSHLPTEGFAPSTIGGDRVPITMA